MITVEDFYQLFTREALRPFQPRPGSDGMEPLLEVRTATDVWLFVLALAGFNDGPTRQGYLHTFGSRCAHDMPDIEVIRFGSEAWIRLYTEEKAAALGPHQPVASFADKTEAIVVFGQHVSGAYAMATAPLYRRPHGDIERLGAWTIVTKGDVVSMRTPLLDAFWEGYRQGKATTN